MTEGTHSGWEAGGFHAPPEPVNVRRKKGNENQGRMDGIEDTPTERVRTPIHAKSSSSVDGLARKVGGSAAACAAAALRAASVAEVPDARPRRDAIVG